MRKIDLYIIGKFLGTFIFALLVITVLVVSIDLSTNVGRFMDNDAPVDKIIAYYFYFILELSGSFMSLVVFISVLFFTSQMAQKTEIVAILSSGVSFYRFSRPYMITALVIAFATAMLSSFIIPLTSETKMRYKYKYNKGRDIDKLDAVSVKLNMQLTKDEYIFIDRYDKFRNQGMGFIYQHYIDGKLNYSLNSDRFDYNEKDSTFILKKFYKRYLKTETDSIISGKELVIKLPIKENDMVKSSFIAQTMTTPDLKHFIEQELSRGTRDIKPFMIEYLNRYFYPISIFILAIIGLAISSRKKRGGMGTNMAIGITIGFIFIVMLKVLKTLADSGVMTPFQAAIFPNAFFGIIALFLYFRRAFK